MAVSRDGELVDKVHVLDAVDETLIIVNKRSSTTSSSLCSAQSNALPGVLLII